MLKGPYKDLPAALQSRAHYAHTPFHTHLRTTESEMYAAGKLIAEKHNLCRGKNAIIIPQGGYSMKIAWGTSCMTRRPMQDSRRASEYRSGDGRMYHDTGSYQ